MCNICPRQFRILVFFMQSLRFLGHNIWSLIFLKKEQNILTHFKVYVKKARSVYLF